MTETDIQFGQENSHNGLVTSVGEDLVNPLAAKLMDMGIPQSVSKASAERLGGTLQRIGRVWSDLTFIYPNKRDRAMPPLQEEWSALTEIVSLDPESRLAVLSRFTRGLGVREGKLTRSQYEFVALAQRGWAGMVLARQKRPLLAFLDGVDPKITFSDPAWITLEAILELSGYPNPTLDNFQGFLIECHARQELVGPEGDVTLPIFLIAFNNWLTTVADQQPK